MSFGSRDASVPIVSAPRRKVRRDPKPSPPRPIPATVDALLGEVRDALDAKCSLPAAYYQSPDLLAVERDRLFLHHWLFVGRDDQIPDDASYRVVETAGGSVILIRLGDGALRAYANVCRHRGAKLLDGSGSCTHIVCPYHAWTYNLDGTLRGAPDMDDVAGFDPARLGLQELLIETWGGFVFVNFDPDAPALLDCLGDLPRRMRSHEPDELRAMWSMQIECACNWKLLLENAMETYHTGIVHRESVGRQTSRSIETTGDWLCIQVLDERSIATMDADGETFSEIPGLDEDARQGTYFTVIQPACQLVFAQDSMWWLNVVPIDATRSRLELGGCFPRAALLKPDFEDIAQAYFDRWETVAREDIRVLEGQQEGLASVCYDPGPLSPRDDQVIALGRRWLHGIESI